MSTRRATTSRARRSRHLALVQLLDCLPVSIERKKGTVFGPTRSGAPCDVHVRERVRVGALAVQLRVRR